MSITCRLPRNNVMTQLCTSSYSLLLLTNRLVPPHPFILSLLLFFGFFWAMSAVGRGSERGQTGSAQPQRLSLSLVHAHSVAGGGPIPHLRPSLDIEPTGLRTGSLS
jgi:hypothetical protein